MSTDELSAHLMPKHTDRPDTVRISTALTAGTYAALHDHLDGEGGAVRDAAIERAILCYLDVETRSGELPGMEVA